MWELERQVDETYTIGLPGDMVPREVETVNPVQCLSYGVDVDDDDDGAGRDTGMLLDMAEGDATRTEEEISSERFSLPTEYDDFEVEPRTSPVLHDSPDSSRLVAIEEEKSVQRKLHHRDRELPGRNSNLVSNSTILLHGRRRWPFLPTTMLPTNGSVRVTTLPTRRASRTCPLPPHG